MQRHARRIGFAGIFLLFTVVASQGQWVMVARAASGRIQQMEQRSADGKSGFDVATVVIQANAQRVYETAVQRLTAHAEAVKVIGQNPKRRMVAFTNGMQTASLQANPLGDKLTQLVVASTLDSAQSSTTSVVVKSIQNVCNELKVTCTLETD